MRPLLATAAFVAALVAALALLWTSLPDVGHAAPVTSMTVADGYTVRACLSDEGESAFPCAWHAPSMGNHRGHSFRIFRDGRVRLITDARAFHLLGDCDSNGPIHC